MTIRPITTPCSIPDCPNTARAHQGGPCDTHYKRLRRLGTTQPDKPVRINGVTPVGYTQAHYRVRAALGSPRDHDCPGCGRQARHWAYDHCDPDELHNDSGPGPYSLDPCRYFPLCVSCHKLWDLRWEGRQRKVATA